MKNLKWITTIFAMFSVVLLNAQDYAEFTDLELTYSQDFNTLDATEGAKNLVWTNGTTPLAGWHAYTLMNTAPKKVVVYSTGTTTVAGSTGLISFGTSGDRAIGCKIANATGDIAYGVKLMNNTSGTIKSLKITYTGEQWAYANPCAQVVDFSYKLNADSLSVAGFTSIPELLFSSPRFVAGTTTTNLIDGNLAENRVAGITYTLNLDIPKGAYIWLRWYDMNDPSVSAGDCINTGVDHQLSIDDVSVQAFLATDIKPASATGIKLYSNPDLITISSEKEIEKVLVYDMTGRIYVEKPAHSKSVQLPANELSDGFYLAKIMMANGQKDIKYFVK